MLREKILNEMKTRGMTINQVAEIVYRDTGIARGTVSRWLSGRGNTTDRTVDAIILALKEKI